MRACIATLFGLLASLGLSAPAVAAADKATCPSAQEVGVRASIEVRPVVPAVKYRYDAGRAQLTQMMSQQGSNAGGHSNVLGLTHGTFKANWQIMPHSIRRGNYFCHYLKTANVTLEVPELTVYIAKEYQQGSCQFHVILTHENEHVRVNQSMVQKYAPIMKETLYRAVPSVSPIASYNNHGGNVLEQALNPTVKFVLQQMYAERNRGNGLIDTSESYKRTSQQCARW